MCIIIIKNQVDIIMFRFITNLIFKMLKWNNHTCNITCTSTNATLIWPGYTLDYTAGEWRPQDRFTVPGMYSHTCPYYHIMRVTMIPWYFMLTVLMTFLLTIILNSVTIKSLLYPIRVINVYIYYKNRQVGYTCNSFIKR